MPAPRAQPGSAGWGKGLRLSLAGGARPGVRRRARVPVVDQALRLLVAHMRVPLAEAQAHHVVVHVVPDLLGAEAVGELLALREQILQVLFQMRHVALHFVSALGRGRGHAGGLASWSEGGAWWADTMR